jgi:hypothetical protein
LLPFENICVLRQLLLRSRLRPPCCSSSPRVRIKRRIYACIEIYIKIVTCTYMFVSRHRGVIHGVCKIYTGKLLHSVSCCLVHTSLSFDARSDIDRLPYALLPVPGYQIMLRISPDSYPHSASRSFSRQMAPHPVVLSIILNIRATSRCSLGCVSSLPAMYNG